MKRVLLVVDPQNYFMSGKWTAHLPKSIKSLIQKGDKFDFVIFTKFVNSGRTNFFKLLNWHKCTGGRDVEMVDELKPFAGKKNTFVKRTYSPFKNGKFAGFLKKRKVKTVYICGTDTDACILATAVDAFDLGFRPIVLKKFCASHSGPARHRWALGLLRAIMGKKSVI